MGVSAIIHPAGGSCSEPSSKHKNTPPELWDTVPRVTESNQRREPERSAPWTSYEDKSEKQTNKIKANQYVLIHVVYCNNTFLLLYLMGFRCLGYKTPTVEVDNQPWGGRLLLYPGEVSCGDGRRL